MDFSTVSGFLNPRDNLNLSYHVYSYFCDRIFFSMNSFQTRVLEPIATATENADSGAASNLHHLAEAILQQIALFLKTGIECIALLIIAFAVLRSIQKLPQILKLKKRHEALSSLRLSLATSLVVAMEFLLAADIAATAVSPTWDSLAKLAVVAIIRTFLDFVLQKEVKELAAEQSQQSARMDNN